MKPTRLKPMRPGTGTCVDLHLAVAAALTKEEQRWRTMDSGLRLKITPTVFHDRTAAELKVDLETGDPAQQQDGGQSSAGNPPRPLSRISKSTLQTKVDVKTMDLFALSSFNNQTSVSGRRWYVPVLGTMWEGAFGDIPVLGGLFSFKRPTGNVQQQSVILTNTLIVPSAMGMASFYCDPDQPDCGERIYMPYQLRFPLAPEPMPLPRSQQTSR
jgi:hypothetical protein